MAEMKQSPLTAIKKECQIQFEWQRKQAILCARRRSRLFNIVSKEHLKLDVALKKFPLFATHSVKKNFGEYKRSYELFHTQIEHTLSVLENRVQIKLIPAPDKNQEIGIWEDYRDDLLDALKDNGRIVDQYEKEGFLAIIQILDTAERLNDFSFPDKGARGKVYQRALEKLRKLTSQTENTFQRAINKRSIKEIQFLSGSYPPITTTRIISRNDNGTNDDIVIHRVIEKGYSRKMTILRKAGVEVTTKI